MTVNTHVVYWIRHEGYSDIKSQGYVGVSKDPEARIYAHWHKANTNPILHVHKAMRKYYRNIVFEIVAEGDEEFCYFLENVLRPERGIGWNTAVGGDIATVNSRRTVSEETRQRIREKALGRKRSEVSIAKFSAAMSGKNLWENSAARKDVWAMAQQFYEQVVAHPKKSSKVLAKEFGLKNCNPWKLVDKLRSGWVPSEDEAYQTWLSTYQKEQT